MDLTLIKVEEKDGAQVVSARELYERLEISDRFSRWFESLLKYGFQENVDFWCVKTSTQQNQYGGIKEIDDYSITIEMAKQICMLQRSEAGRKYREYFLQLEQAWNSPEAIMARAMQIANKTLEEVKKRAFIAETTLNKIADGTGCFTINQTAKALKLPYGNVTLYKHLREMGILNSDNSPRQDQINAGHFKVVIKNVQNIGNKPVTLTTGKGLVYLAKKFNTEIDESISADA